jgi:predicted CXXCH cytochrome family protein
VWQSFQTEDMRSTGGLRYAKQLLLAVCLFVALLTNAAIASDQGALLDDPAKIPALLADGKINFEEVPNPHWQADACRGCHDMSQGEAGKMPPLLSSDVNMLCGNCHDPSLVAEYIHAVDMEPPDEFLDRMPEEFLAVLETQDGLINCVMCHDLPLQCDPEKFSMQEINFNFFRGGPYSSRTDLCFNCHNPEDYERYNPHDQVTDEGELDTEQCFFCHNVTPNRAGARSINDVTFNVAENLKRLCTGCHPYRPHPGGAWFSPTGNRAGGGPNHLKVPPEKIRKKLEETVAATGTVMPLEPETGEVFCATCHNPHERGVQYYHKADIGADGYKRLRQEKFTICVSCHDL